MQVSRRVALRRASLAAAGSLGTQEDPPEVRGVWRMRLREAAQGLVDFCLFQRNSRRNTKYMNMPPMQKP